MKHRMKQKGAGFYLVFTAISIFVLCLFGLLVLGVGFLTINKTKVQAVANLTAYAALSGFMESPSKIYSERATAGLAKANDIVRANRPIASKSGNFGSLTMPPNTADADSSGEVVFGRWHFEDPDGSANPQDPCTGEYPCFVANGPNEPADAIANAAQVKVRNQSGNDIIAPLASMLGYTGFTIDATATATIVQRCTGFLIDTSLSVTQETHETVSFPIWNDIELTAPPQSYPRIRSDSVHKAPTFYAYREAPTYADGIRPPSPLNGTGAIPPSCSATGLSTNDLMQLVWCAYQSDTNFDLRDSSVPLYMRIDPKLHFASDYAITSSNSVADAIEITKDIDGEEVPIFIDKFYDGVNHLGPQPFATFLRAFNSASRRMIEQQVSGDRALLAGFAGKMIERQVDGVAAPGFVGPTADLGYIAQLTNYLNLGVYMQDITGVYTPYSLNGEVSVEKHPNFLDMGLVPLSIVEKPQQESTHLAEGLYRVATALTEQCPSGSAKSIILATDGIATCMWGNDTTSPGDYSPENASSCEPDVEHYLAAEAQVLGPHVLSHLLENDISVTTLVRGAQVDPHYLNIQKMPVPASGTYPEGEKYYDYFEAVELGYSGLGLKPLVLNNLPATIEDVPFHRALGLLVELSARTGGIYCPLLDPSANQMDYLNGRLRDSVRLQNQPERRALYNLTVPEQATDCALRALGNNPYILVEK